MQINPIQIEAKIETPIEFCIPIKLIPGYELRNFHSQMNINDYLLVINNNYYKLNEATFSLITSIENNPDLESIRKDFSYKQNKDYSIDNIIKMLNELTNSIGILKGISEIEKRKKKKSFLTLQVPIFSIQILEPITRLLQILFKPQITIILISIIIVSHLYASILLFTNANLLVLLDSPLVFISTILISLLSVIFHELGHSSACRYFGAQHKEIGIGLYLIYPVFYSNITDIWRLKPHQRAIVDIAGIYFQYIFNIFLFILYLISKQSVLLFAIKFICVQSIINLNPFFRYDGYWLATDLLGIPNLRKRSSEYIQYLIKYHILRKRIDHPIFNVNKSSKYIFYAYSIVSNLFFVYFIVFIFKSTPKIAQEIIVYFNDLRTVLFGVNQTINLNEVGIILYKIFFRLILFFIYTYFIFVISKRIIFKPKAISQ